MITVVDHSDLKEEKEEKEKEEKRYSGLLLIGFSCGSQKNPAQGPSQCAVEVTSLGYEIKKVLTKAPYLS